MTHPSSQPDPDCVFCKIVGGQIPAAKVLDTPNAVAFLDITPLAEGHTLLVPRQHYATLTEMPPGELERLTAQLPALSAAILSATGAEAFNVLQNNGSAAGQVVEHVHIHIIPRAAGDGLGYRWNTRTYTAGRADELRRKIESALGA